MKKIINIILFAFIIMVLVYHFAGDRIKTYADDLIGNQTIIGEITNSGIKQDDNDATISTDDFEYRNFNTGASGSYIDFIVRDEIIDNIEDRYVSHKDFIGLFGYYQKKLAGGKSVNIDKFLNTVLNLPTDKINYDIYIGLLDKLHKKNKLSDSELQYYKTFANIMKLKFDDFNHDIGLINYSGLNQQKIDFIKSVYKSNDLYKSYKNPPKYYLIALLGSNLITNGYYEPARRLATEILKINESYILTNQIMAYYNFIMGKNAYSEEFLTKLIKIDDSNTNFYKYLLGITYYESGQYIQAAGILQNIDKSEYSLTINKYLLTSYLYLGDRNNAKIVINNIIKEDTIDIYDYKTIWKYLFYPSNAFENSFFLKPEKYTYYQSNRDFADQLISNCNSFVQQKQITTDICKLGEYGKTVANATDEETLEDIVKQITNGTLGVDYIFAWVGDYYTYIGRKDLSKAYYLQSYKSSDDEDYKYNLKNKVIQLFK